MNYLLGYLVTTKKKMLKPNYKVIPEIQIDKFNFQYQYENHIQ